MQVTFVTMCYAGPCYRCLFPIAPLPESCSRCSDAGVLGVIPGIIGSLQALEAIKIMAGVGQVASRKLVIFDGLAMRFHTVKLRARYSSSCTTPPLPPLPRPISSQSSSSFQVGFLESSFATPSLLVLSRFPACLTCWTADLFLSLVLFLAHPVCFVTSRDYCWVWGLGL